MEWQAFKDSLCECGHPRLESFAIENSFKYSAHALDCHACAVRERAAHRDRESQEQGAPPIAGRKYAVTLDD